MLPVRYQQHDDGQHMQAAPRSPSKDNKDIQCRLERSIHDCSKYVICHTADSHPYLPRWPAESSTQTPKWCRPSSRLPVGPGQRPQHTAEHAGAGDQHEPCSSSIGVVSDEMTSVNSNMHDGCMAAPFQCWHQLDD